MRYEIFAAHIKTDFVCSNCVSTDILEEFFKETGIGYTFKSVNIRNQKRETNCCWCSWNRRKALFEIAGDLRCNKLALGHHKDDIVETILLNLFFKGEISSMKPRQELFNGKIVLIRPLCYVEENMTREYAQENSFPIQSCECPLGKVSQRMKVKELIREMEKSVPGTSIKTNIFNSISRINTNIRC